MAKLDLDLVKYLKLPKLENVDQVRRKILGYAVDEKNRLIAVSFSGKSIKKLILEEECTELEYLYVSENKDLTEVEIRAVLPKLNILNISKCNLKGFVFQAGFENLSEIYLQKNQLESISFQGSYPELKYLELSQNQLSEFKLPAGTKLKDHLYLQKNNLSFPPQEIAERGGQAVLDYFAALEKEKADQKPQAFLKEIKILLVGEGMAGKTSLLKQLAGKAFDKNESQTHGVNIEILDLENLPIFQDHSALTGVKARCWDFGGQEIMHASHQFFLTNRSVYLLILDSRTDAKKDYWLKHIEKFGGDSPTLVVANKIDEYRNYDLPRSELKNKFPFIEQFYRVSCKNQDGLAELKQAIVELIPQTEFFKTPVPNSWLEIKNQLEEETTNKKYIDQKRFLEICASHKVDKASEQETLLTFLNDLGLVLHFKKLKLKHFYVLDPHWVTIGVYKIINSPSISNGVFDEKQLEYILNEEIQKREEYDPAKAKTVRYSSAEQSYLIEVMEQFELLYKTSADTYLVPDLLPKESTQAVDFAVDETTLKFVLKYDFLPTSVISRFILRVHDDLLTPTHLWRTGAVLRNKIHGCTAMFKADVDENRIEIFINGEGMTKREYLAHIRSIFGSIHTEFQGLKITELIPLPGHPEKMVSYKYLLGLEKMGEPYYPDGELEKKFLVSDLLEKIASKQQRHMEQEKPESKQHIYHFHEKVERVITDIQQYQEAEKKTIEPKVATPEKPRKWYETHLAKALFIGILLSAFVYYLLRKYTQSVYALDVSLSVFMLVTLYFWLRFSNSKRRFYRAAAFVFGTIALINTLPFLSVELAFKQQLEQSNLDFLFKLGLQDNPVLNVVLVVLAGFLYWLDSGKE